MDKDGADIEQIAREVATKVADRCQKPRKPGKSPNRYATIWQAARLGALEVLAASPPSENKDSEDGR